MKKNVLFVGLTFLLLLAACHKSNAEQTNSNTTNSSAQQQQLANVKKTAIPTLLIHGYQGTAYSYHSMIGRMEKRQAAKREMVLTVHTDGTVDAQGKLSGKKDNPLVQVLFEDNVNNEWNQASWLKSVLLYLKDKQKVDTVNLVGHSMGGVDIYRYLGTYPKKDDLPTVAKYVAIGAPLNDFTDTSTRQSLEDLLTKGPSVASSRYQDFKAMIEQNQLSSDLPVLLIAGQLDKKTFSDGTVPTTSALSVYPLLKDNGFNIHYQIVYGQNAQHSMLHENPKVDQLIENFLWQ